MSEETETPRLEVVRIYYLDEYHFSFVLHHYINIKIMRDT